MSLLSILCLCATAAHADPSEYLDFARRGWVYELRSAMFRRSAAPIVINGRDMAGSTICLVGEAPHPQTAAALAQFGALMEDVWGVPVPVRQGGADLRDCLDGALGRTVYLRLYSGRAPHSAYGADMRALDTVYGIGFRPDQTHWLVSPGQAQTFFGLAGRVTHISLKQAAGLHPGEIETRFYSSILTEELYQAFTFGMDILHFDPEEPFVSKLEEVPRDLRRLGWETETYMREMLTTNPGGLCPFDVFMLHAVGTAPVEQTNSPAFLAYIDGAYETLARRTDATLARFEGSAILDPECKADG